MLLRRLRLHPPKEGSGIFEEARRALQTSPYDTKPKALPAEQRLPPQHQAFVKGSFFLLLSKAQSQKLVQEVRHRNLKERKNRRENQRECIVSLPRLKVPPSKEARQTHAQNSYS